jgi:hypothetical protein
MFRDFTNSLAAVNAKKDTDEPKTMSPTLRADIYKAMDQAKAWMIGGMGSGQAGDGVSFGPILSTIQKHFPETKVGLESVGQVDGETAMVVAGITNMILTMSQFDGMAGGMTMRTWVDTVCNAHAKAKDAVPGRKGLIANGITRGINQNTDVTLMTREFAARIQIISLLKSGACFLFSFLSEYGFECSLYFFSAHENLR